MRRYPHAHFLAVHCSPFSYYSNVRPASGSFPFSPPVHMNLLPLFQTPVRFGVLWLSACSRKQQGSWVRREFTWEGPIPSCSIPIGSIFKDQQNIYLRIEDKLDLFVLTKIVCTYRQQVSCWCQTLISLLLARGDLCSCGRRLLLRIVPRSTLYMEKFPDLRVSLVYSSKNEGAFHTHCIHCQADLQANSARRCVSRLPGIHKRRILLDLNRSRLIVFSLGINFSF